MAIVLDLINDVKTNFIDFVESLEQYQDGIRCCLDVDFIVFNKHTNQIKDIVLVPLSDFTCNRTITGCKDTEITVETTFGLIQKDFIKFGFKEVTITESDGYKSLGLLISSDNPYYEIVESLSKHFNFITNDDNGHSFILTESDLSKINLVPFNLKYHDSDFYVDNIESEMATSEFDAIIDSMYCSDYAL